jgi:hypothetical protein
LSLVFIPPDAVWKIWAIIAAVVFGCVYFPMSFTAVTTFDSLSALNPLLVVLSIVKVFAPYLLTVVLFFCHRCGKYAQRFISR